MPAVPSLAAVVVCVAPRRAIAGVVFAAPSRRPLLALALAAPRSRTADARGRQLAVVDAPRASSSPWSASSGSQRARVAAYLATGGALLRPPARPRALLRRAVASGRRCWRSRSPTICRGVAADRGDDRRFGAAGRLQRAPRALEAGWKYLVLTTLGLPWRCSASSSSPPSVGRRARSLAWQLLDARAPARDRRSSPSCSSWPAGDEDRLGAGAQLAAGRPQRGAAAGQRAAVRGAAADRPARRLARRSWRSRPPSAGRPASVSSLRSRIAHRRRAVPLAPAAGSACSPTRASSTWA